MSQVNENTPESQVKNEIKDKPTKRTKQYEKDLLAGVKMCCICDKIKELAQFKLWGNGRGNRLCFSSRCYECESKNIPFPNQFEVDTRRQWKICNKCNKTKDLTHYLIDNRFNVYYTKCNECGHKLTNKNRNLRRKNNQEYRLRSTIKSRIGRALNGQRKTEKLTFLLGTSINELKKHLESKFLQGMTWENRSDKENGFHVDHILPCSLFTLSNLRHQKACFHYTNLRPLWPLDNIQKNDKLPNGRSVQNMTEDEKRIYLIGIGFDWLFDESLPIPKKYDYKDKIKF